MARIINTVPTTEAENLRRLFRFGSVIPQAHLDGRQIMGPRRLREKLHFHTGCVTVPGRKLSPIPDREPRGNNTTSAVVPFPVLL